MNEYCVNIADLTKDPILAQSMIAPISRSMTIIPCEKDRGDGGGLLLEVTDEQAEAIIQVIRFKYSKNEMRCYKNKMRI